MKSASRPTRRAHRTGFRRLTLALVLAALPPAALHGQADTANVLGPAYHGDFAVADVPALLLADINADALLRPSVPSAFAVSVNLLYGENTEARLPRSFGIEVAPGLWGRGIGSRAYGRWPWLSGLRLSLAAREGSGDGAGSVSLGVRTSLIDRAELRGDPAYHRRVAPLLSTLGEVEQAMRASARRPSSGGDLATLVQRREILREELAAARDSATEEHWNSLVLDVAAGLGAEARDPFGRNPALSGYAGWATGGVPVGGWGQLLVGAGYTHLWDPGSSGWRGAVRVGARLYAGRNEAKAFLGAGMVYESDPRLVVHAGAELRVWRGLWATGTVGFQGPPFTGDHRRDRLTSYLSFRAARF